jgi:hypothetical protein
LAQNISDYLILNDIGSYTKITSGGPTGSVLAGADHFYLDHSDTALGIADVNDAQKIWVEVQVTQHTGGDSDRWLLHEVEDSYRDEMGLLTDGTVMRRILQNGVYIRFLWLGLGSGHFRWLSNNVVVDIEYTDLQGTKPEPIEVVKAYLSKFPSTITLTDADLKGNTHSVQWIKDEMDRRLWLCDKWNAQFQTGKVTQADLIYNLDRSMGVFLNYRQKYYGVSATDDLNAMSVYMQNNDLASIQTKLTEYKTWWSKNKGKSITLPSAVK